MVSFYLIYILNKMNANYFLFFMHRSGGLCSSSLTYTNSQLPSGLRGPGQVCLRAVIEESVGAQQQVPSVSSVLGATLVFAGHHQAVQFKVQIVKDMKLMLGSIANAARVGAERCSQCFPVTPRRDSTWMGGSQPYCFGPKESISASLQCQLKHSATQCNSQVII